VRSNDEKKKEKEGVLSWLEKITAEGGPAISSSLRGRSKKREVKPIPQDQFRSVLFL